MESRTSFGKKGSVQHVSECPADASQPFQAWVSRPVVLVGIGCLPIVSGGCARPEQAAV
jgi:hypothetical protein